VLWRTFKYRLYPTRRQDRLLVEQLRFTRELYNAALEQRIAAYELTCRSTSQLEQSRELTHLRRECPEWLPEGMPRSAQEYALRRLELAFQGFFRRLKRGETPGFPRFKGAQRWDTLSCQYGKGCTFRDEIQRVYWAGVGNIKVNQHRPIPEGAERKKVEIKRLGRHWFVCVEVRGSRSRNRVRIHGPRSALIWGSRRSRRSRPASGSRGRARSGEPSSESRSSTARLRAKGAGRTGAARPRPRSPARG
jgi:transposase